jgi:hypothetical protein
MPLLHSGPSGKNTDKSGSLEMAVTGEQGRTEDRRAPRGGRRRDWHPNCKLPAADGTSRRSQRSPRSLPPSLRVAARRGLRERSDSGRGPPGGHPPSFSARAAATTRVITRCSAPRRPAAALHGPPPRPVAGSSPAPADVEAVAASAAPAPPPARFPILAGPGPQRWRFGATLLGEATAAAAAREPWSGL